MFGVLLLRRFPDLLPGIVQQVAQHLWGPCAGAHRHPVRRTARRAAPFSIAASRIPAPPGAGGVGHRQVPHQIHRKEAALSAAASNAVPEPGRRRSVRSCLHAHPRQPFQDSPTCSLVFGVEGQMHGYERSSTMALPTACQDCSFSGCSTSMQVVQPGFAAAGRRYISSARRRPSVSRPLTWPSSLRRGRSARADHRAGWARRR